MSSWTFEPFGSDDLHLEQSELAVYTAFSDDAGEVGKGDEAIGED